MSRRTPAYRVKLVECHNFDVLSVTPLEQNTRIVEAYLALVLRGNQRIGGDMRIDPRQMITDKGIAFVDRIGKRIIDTSSTVKQEQYAKIVRDIGGRFPAFLPIIKRQKMTVAARQQAVSRGFNSAFPDTLDRTVSELRTAREFEPQRRPKLFRRNIRGKERRKRRH